MWYVCDVLYAVLYVCVSCFAVRGCAVSRRYIHVCNCDMFSIVNVYLDHLKLCVLIVKGMPVVVNVMLSLMSVMSHLLPSARTMVKLCTLGVFGLGVSLVSAPRVCFDSVYVDLQYDEISLTFTAGSVSLCCVCDRRGTLCGCGGCYNCDVCTVTYNCVACVSVERVWWCEVDGNVGVGDG